MELSKFLEEQKQYSNNLFTIHEIKESDKIKLTPYSKTGCNCGVSLNIDKSLIKEVEPQNEFKSCCGETLQVVKVVFIDNASLSLDEIFSQLESKEIFRSSSENEAATLDDFIERRDIQPENPKSMSNGCWAERCVGSVTGNVYNCVEEKWVTGEGWVQYCSRCCVA